MVISSSKLTNFMKLPNNLPAADASKGLQFLSRMYWTKMDLKNYLNSFYNYSMYNVNRVRDIFSSRGLDRTSKMC